MFCRTLLSQVVTLKVMTVTLILTLAHATSDTDHVILLLSDLSFISASCSSERYMSEYLASTLDGVCDYHTNINISRENYGKMVETYNVHIIEDHLRQVGIFTRKVPIT